MVNKIREISVVEGLVAIYDLLWTRRINIFNMPKWNFSFVSVTIHPSRWPLRPTLPSLSHLFHHLYTSYRRIFLVLSSGIATSRRDTRPLCRRGECKPWKHRGICGLTVKDVRVRTPPRTKETTLLVESGPAIS